MRREGPVRADFSDGIAEMFERLLARLWQRLLPRGYEGPSPYIDSPVWPWVATGTILSALFVIYLLGRAIGWW
jgi:hypothetical protein